MEFRTRFTKKERSGKVCAGGRTLQASRDECNVNLIMARFEKTGQLPQMIRRDPQYGEFASAPEYHEAMCLVVKAQEQFEALPAQVRKRFGNDPAAFLGFAVDPQNQRELVRMGLATLNEDHAKMESAKLAAESRKDSEQEEEPPPKKAPVRSEATRRGRAAGGGPSA
ncbi:MAG: scaffold protein [Microviridae sp. ctOsc38]|nr:MAG: scaffold protein [Microviridae sp. ctOsc38]